MREDRSVELTRSAGILLHPTSLPSGRLDREAYRFVDWLAAAGQSWWQVLPLGPPDEFGSPYRPPSAFAASSQLLARPTARVSVGEVDEFVTRHAYWARSWAAFAAENAIADQVRFEREWGALREYAAERGIGLIGDLPIYVSDVGADLAAWPELFERGEVAGAPPDALSATGQRWGNPLYEWVAHRATGYRWWRERFRRTFELVDLCRLDHFRGFVSTCR
jgi:4-alpha-glucanotransferase